MFGNTSLKGQGVGGLDLFQVIIGVILIFAAGVPIVATSVNAAHLNGTDATVGALATTVLVIGGIVVIARGVGIL